MPDDKVHEVEICGRHVLRHGRQAAVMAAGEKTSSTMRQGQLRSGVGRLLFKGESIEGTNSSSRLVFILISVPGFRSFDFQARNVFWDQ